MRYTILTIGLTEPAKFQKLSVIFWTRLVYVCVYDEGRLFAKIKRRYRSGVIGYYLRYTKRRSSTDTGEYRGKGSSRRRIAPKHFDRSLRKNRLDNKRRNRLTRRRRRDSGVPYYSSEYILANYFGTRLRYNSDAREIFRIRARARTLD